MPSEPSDFRGREPGASVYYSEAATRRYKSQWMRYQGAQELLRNGDLIYNKDGIKRFRSDRSPVGYWEVSLKDEASVVLIKTTHRQNPATYTTPSTTTTVYPRYVVQELRFPVLSKLKFNKISIQGSVTPDGHPTSSFKQEVIILEVLNPGDYAPEDKIIQNVCYSNGGSIAPDVVPYKEGWDYGVGTGNPPLYIAQEIDKNSVTSHFISFGSGGLISNTIVPLTFPKIVIEQTNWQGFQVGEFDLGASWENFYSEILYHYDGESGKECTCPDWQKKADALPQSSYLSEHADRSWEESDAGAPDPPRECKHMIAAQIIDDPENYKPPTDRFLMRDNKDDYKGRGFRPRNRIPKMPKMARQPQMRNKPLSARERSQQEKLKQQRERGADLGQEVWTGSSDTGLYKGSIQRIDLGADDIDTPPEDL